MYVGRVPWLLFDRVAAIGRASRSVRIADMLWRPHADCSCLLLWSGAGQRWAGLAGVWPAPAPAAPARSQHTLILAHPTMCRTWTSQCCSLLGGCGLGASGCGLLAAATALPLPGPRACVWGGVADAAGQRGVSAGAGRAPAPGPLQGLRLHGRPVWLTAHSARLHTTWVQ